MRVLSIEDVKVRKEVRENYKKWILVVDIIWRQNLREFWY